MTTQLKLHSLNSTRKILQFVQESLRQGGRRIASNLSFAGITDTHIFI